MMTAGTVERGLVKLARKSAPQHFPASWNILGKIPQLLPCPSFLLRQLPRVELLDEESLLGSAEDLSYNMTTHIRPNDLIRPYTRRSALRSANTRWVY
jgi:hypothetical protein